MRTFIKIFIYILFFVWNYFQSYTQTTLYRPYFVNTEGLAIYPVSRMIEQTSDSGFILIGNFLTGDDDFTDFYWGLYQKDV